MKTPHLNQINGFILIINTFLPLVFLFTFVLIGNSFVIDIHNHTCLALLQAKQSYNEINDIKNFKQLELINSTESADLRVDNSNQSYTQCDIKTEFNFLLTNDLYNKAKENIDDEITSVGNKFSQIKKTITNKIPKFPSINIPHVNLKINFPPKKIKFPVRLKMDIGKPINAVINIVNVLDNSINQTLTRFGNSISNTLTGIVDPEREKVYLEIQKVTHKQAILWQTFKQILQSIINATTKFYWFALILILWSILSYLFWAYTRIQRGFELLKGRSINSVGTDCT